MEETERQPWYHQIKLSTEKVAVCQIFHLPPTKVDNESFKELVLSITAQAADLSNHQNFIEPANVSRTSLLQHI